MADKNRLPLEELRGLEDQIAAQPGHQVTFLKDGMLLVIRAAIAAEVELERRG